MAEELNFGTTAGKEVESCMVEVVVKVEVLGERGKSALVRLTRNNESPLKLRNKSRAKDKPVVKQSLIVVNQRN